MNVCDRDPKQWSTDTLSYKLRLASKSASTRRSGRPKDASASQGSPARPAATHPKGNFARIGCTWYQSKPEARTGPSTTNGSVLSWEERRQAPRLGVDAGLAAARRSSETVTR